jgi:hypothetical protein
MKQIEFLFKVRDEANFRKVSTKVILAEINAVLESVNYFKSTEKNSPENLDNSAN